MAYINTPNMKSWVSFCSQLEQKNSEKKADAPNALVLISSYDWNGGLTSWNNRFLLAKIAATHRIYFSFFEKKEQIRESIHNVTHPLQNRINLLILKAHGNSSHIKLGKKTSYTTEDVSSEDFAELDEHANIFLLSCNTGLGLAQKIADATNRTIFAPYSASNSDLCLSTCPKHGLEIRQYATLFKPTVKRFLFNNISGFQKGKPSFFCDETREEDSLFFQEQMEFLKHAAEAGDREAQCFLGDVYLQQKAFDKAEEWYRKAIANGEIRAIQNLGFLHLSRGDVKKAEACYQKAIAEGSAETYLYLGDLYHNNNELKKAKECWVKIVEDQVPAVLPKALLNLANLHYKEKDLIQAMEYYQKAALAGNFEAQMEFYSLSYQIEKLKKKEGNKRELEEDSNKELKENSLKTEPSQPHQKTQKL